jgi:hypothetical protein
MVFIRYLANLHLPFWFAYVSVITLNEVLQNSGHRERLFAECGSTHDPGRGLAKQDNVLGRL